MQNKRNWLTMILHLSFQGEKGNQGEPGVAGKHVCNSLYASLVVFLMQVYFWLWILINSKTYALNFET